MAILHPINSAHTAPLVCGVSRATAKCHVTSDVVNDISLTSRQVYNEARRAFKSFCNGQDTNCLTDDLEALRTLYVSTYADTYHAHYTKTLNQLEAMINEDERVLSLMGDLDCVDQL